MHNLQFLNIVDKACGRVALHEGYDFYAAAVFGDKIGPDDGIDGVIATLGEHIGFYYFDELLRSVFIEKANGIDIYQGSELEEPVLFVN